MDIETIESLTRSVWHQEMTTKSRPFFLMLCVLMIIGNQSNKKVETLSEYKVLTFTYLYRTSSRTVVSLVMCLTYFSNVFI